MRIVERYPLWLKIARGGGAASLFLPARFVFSKLYGLGLACTGALARGAEASSKPVAFPRRPAPEVPKRPTIVSIGNLEAGGGGKTPFAIALADAIRARGGRAVVVTRGYRGILEGSGAFIVDDAFSGEPPAGAKHIAAASNGTSFGAAVASLAGDEIAIYRSRGVSVVMDADRVRGARVAAALDPTHVLLDDAFRHRLPAKDVDILLLDAERPFGNGALIPLGSLREPRSAARRADVVVFTRAREERVPVEAAPFVEGKPVFFARHEAVNLLTREGARPLGDVAGRRTVLFSGIARPESFENLAVSLGAKVETSIRFEDHHRYEMGDINEIVSAGGDGFVYLTTEKDFVKVAALFPAGADVRALRIGMRVAQFDLLLELVRG